MSNYIKSDLMRYYGKSDGCTLVKAYLTDRTFRFQCAMRLCRETGVKKYIGKVLYKMNPMKHQIQIPHKVKIGYGLFIGHGGPLVVHPNTVIGNNCNLSQFTTIGSNSNQGAIIGDNTYIGPNVCIVENVIIGNNVTIGAGSVVTKDIPDNATAVGNYAKIINYNNPGRHVNNRWEIDVVN